MEGPRLGAVRKRLLAWFDEGHRDLPWRRTRDPYRILVAEYLLQRTRVVSGTRYYERFLQRFPDVRALAEAPEGDVLRAWEGLGFYRRARNLHAAARAIVEKHGGRIPDHAEALRALPGIGPYTAGAVASIAFGQRVPAIDGNATRVLARLFRIEDDVSRGTGRVRVAQIAHSLVPASRPGAFNQALMEVGATICTPASPACKTCPLHTMCLARKAGLQSTLPRQPRSRKPARASVAFAHVVSHGRILLVKRPESGLLGGFWALPGGEIVPGRGGAQALRRLVADQTGLQVEVGEAVAPVSQIFSHRRWSGRVYRCALLRVDEPASGARWVAPDEARTLPLVASHRKILEGFETRRSPESFDSPSESTHA